MVSLEQIKLLESKVSKTIEYVKKVTDENRQLKEKLDSYQKRIEELEGLVLQFKEDQSRIEDGILSALDRLNQFEDALESKLSNDLTTIPKKAPVGESKKPGPASAPEPGKSEETSSEDTDGELDIF
jgi:chromosome segregation ATPase